MAKAEYRDGRGRRGGRSRGRGSVRSWPGPWLRLSRSRWWLTVRRDPSTAAVASFSSGKKTKTPRPRKGVAVARPTKTTKPSRLDPIRRIPPPQPRAPPALPNELIQEILVRVAPDDPATLVRAAVACRRWCRLVADPAFRRRRLQLHRATPPMLGVMCDGTWNCRFVPTSSCRPPRCNHLGLRSFDARHGRVLLHGITYMDFVVWDPITDKRVAVPRPPWILRSGSRKATVLCAATGVCHHLDCHRGPFIVVLMGTNDEEMFCCIYSSESGAWSKPTYGAHPGHSLEWSRSALVGNSLVFALNGYRRVVKYDLGTQQMSVIALPYVRGHNSIPIELTTLEDGQLGFARVENSELCLWSRGEGDDDVQGWKLCKVIDLEGLFPLVDSSDLTYGLVGFVESVCVAFMAVQGGLFTIDMKSGLMKKVYESPNIICCAVPYINFCTPALAALEAPSGDDGQRSGISSA